MGNLINKNDFLPGKSGRQPDKIETHAGKYTARVTKTYNNDDGSQYKVTKRLNKDLSVTDKVEYRHK